MNRTVFNEIMQILFPSDIKCIVCGNEITPNRYGVCDKCSFDLNSNYCARCGRHKVGIGEYCGECAKPNLHFDEARSSVVYDGCASKIIQRFKYGDAKYLAEPLSEYLLDTLVATDWKFDCFTFVPIHKKRLKRRGYNQAELLAAALSEMTTKPCIKLIDKIKPTPNQARSSRAERENNLKDSFAICEKPPERVVLIDDVMTTGSTANECAKVLKRAGAKSVYVLTFASVSENPLTDKQTRSIRNFRK